MSELRPGDVLRQKYQVEQPLGQGGMAVVYAATHLHLQQRVALKLLKPGSPRDPEVIERFLREARAASRLQGANVARVLDVDTLDDNTPFIVMELLEGCDLAALLRHRAVPIHEAVTYVREACEALAEAHALGIIHRDVKPANLFLTKKRSGEPVVKVLDFGISKLTADTRITEAQVGMGSAEYMSPEQMKSAGDVDGRTDVWSLGVTLYELCTGRTPFHADSVGGVLTAVLTKKPDPPQQIRPEVPAPLAAVILRAMEKDPARRYATVQDLSRALAPFAAPGALQAGPAGAQPGPRRGFPPLAGVAIALVVLIIGIIAFGIGHGRGDGAAERFTLDADALIDAQTKLTWQRRPAAAGMDWAAAKAHCQRLGGGYRLPTAEELKGLLVVTTMKPPLDPASFPTSAIDVFWSSSSAGSGAAWAVHFSSGRVAETAVTARNRVRCVR